MLQSGNLFLHIKSYVPYCRVKPPHIGLCTTTVVYTCAEREILYNTYQEMAIWKSIVTLIYRELLALGRKIDI
jgi:hypothetical protein